MARKAVLEVLADYVTDTGKAYPQMATIRRDTGLDTAAIVMHLESLKESGIISDTGKRTGDAGDVIVWQLNSNKAIKPEAKPREPRSITPTELLDAEKIYKIYPRPVDPKKSLRLIQKCIETYGFDVVFEKTKRYSEAFKASGTENQLACHSTTYFRNDRFNDDPATWNFKVVKKTSVMQKIEHAPTPIQLMDYAREKTTSKDEAATWATNFNFIMHRRKWMMFGKPVEWQIEFSKFIANQKVQAGKVFEFPKNILSAGADEAGQK